ncbi:MAG: ABC transporter ATP-binding protein [Clostridia bacterium]|nr:ABC transporter ATP-binding protein [Clostridia bacterium]
MPPPIVVFSHVSMQYPGVLAVDDVSLSIRQGEVFALVGENGAGKSTLMNMLYGLVEPTLGEITVRGQKAGCRPRQAMDMGVSMVHQHFKLVPSFTVAQNVLLGREPRKGGLLYDGARANALVRELADRYGLAVNPADVVGELSVGLQQRVEILKALRQGADVLILDEPTAVLTPQEAEELFQVVRRMVADRRMTVILITHKLPEVMRASDRVGVMKRGRLVAVLDTRATGEMEIASLMVGREMPAEMILPLTSSAPSASAEEAATGRPVSGEAGGTPAAFAAGDAKERSTPVIPLRIEGLQALGDRGFPALRGVELSVRAGEIVGICGVEGNGQTELAECILGMRAYRGSILVGGKDVSRLTSGEIRRLGVSFVPEDRLRTGLDTRASVMENLLLGRQREPAFNALGLYLRRGRVRRYARERVREFDIRSAGVDEPVGALSGGNMQKTVIAREFSFGASLLIISQPTRGVDIGATRFIHRRIMEERDRGCAILLISADLDELFHLCDRLAALFKGQVTACFAANAVTREEIGYAMTGGGQKEGACLP